MTVDLTEASNCMSDNELTKDERQGMSGDAQIIYALTRQNERLLTFTQSQADEIERLRADFTTEQRLCNRAAEDSFTANKRIVALEAELDTLRTIAAEMAEALELAYDTIVTWSYPENPKLKAVTAALAKYHEQKDRCQQDTPGK